MVTSRTPSSGPGSPFNLTPSPPPRRTQYTFSTQRAEFTKPVPAALLPVYPNFAQDLSSSVADDEASIVNKLTESMVTPQGQKYDSSAADWNSQICYRGVDTMATVRQAAVRGFAEKSGISPTSISNLSLKTANLDRSLSKIDYTKEHPEISSNSVMARFASFLGLNNRRERQLDKSTSNASVSLTDVSLPALSPFKDSIYSRLPSSSRSDSLRPSSSLSFSNSLCAGDDLNTSLPIVIEDDREREQSEPLGQADKSKRRKYGQDPSYTTYTPPGPNRHLRSHSLDISRAHLLASNQASLSPFAGEVPPHSRSRSMDVQSIYGQKTFMDRNLQVSSSHAPPVSVPPNCVLVQIWAVGLDESDRQLVVGSDGYGAPDPSGSQETPDRRRTMCKERQGEENIGYSIFNDPKLLGWSSNFWEKKKEKEPVHGWLTASNVKPLITSDQETTQKHNGMEQENSLPSLKIPQLLEAGCFPGQSFVGRVLEVGSVVKKSSAARDDWVVGLVDIRKCGALAEFIVIDWRQVHRVPAPYETYPLDHATSALVSDSPPGKLTEDVVRNQCTSEGKSSLFVPLTIDELALLPLSGIPAYRAVKTCIDAFPVEQYSNTTYCQRRRALVLRGHDGVGAMAVQMLVRQGWRVSVHVPFSRVPWDATQAEADVFMFAIEERLKTWGADEVIYDDGISYTNWDGEIDDRKAAVVRVIETLRGDGDVFDAVLDFVGGTEIREASETLLRLNGCPASHPVGQFTTFLGANAQNGHFGCDLRPDFGNLSTITLQDPQSYADEPIDVLRDVRGGCIGRRVNHTLMEDVFESEDEEVWKILGSVLRLALKDGIRPHVEEAGGEIFGRRRVVSFEKSSDVLVDGDLLSDGGMIVVREVR